MDVLTFRTPGLGDQTYLLVHEGQGVLVDPQRDWSVPDFIDTGLGCQVGEFPES